jgi:hypothetical protein
VLAVGEDEFVELDEARQPKRKAGRRGRPGARGAGARRRRACPRAARAVRSRGACGAPQAACRRGERPPKPRPWPLPRPRPTPKIDVPGRGDAAGTDQRVWPVAAPPPVGTQRPARWSAAARRNLRGTRIR